MQARIIRLLVRQTTLILWLLLLMSTPTQGDSLALSVHCSGHVLDLQECLRRPTCSALTSDCQSIGVTGPGFGRTQLLRMHVCTWQQCRCGRGSDS